MQLIRLTDEEKIAMFWLQVDRSGGTFACWEWQGKQDSQGPGVFSYQGGTLAYQAAYRIAKGDIPSGMVVMHSCDNRLCCNPIHLSLGTHQENMQDKISKGRQSRYGAKKKIEPPTFFSGYFRMTCPQCGCQIEVENFFNAKVNRFLAGEPVAAICRRCQFQIAIAISPTE